MTSKISPNSTRAGRWVKQGTSDEPYFVFIPHLLPPKPSIHYDAQLYDLLERANRALGRLDGISAFLPDPDLFIYSYVRKEAVLSSQIEGTRSSLSDLPLFEMDTAPGVPMGDVREVSNYVAAMEHGLKRLREVRSVRLFSRTRARGKSWARRWVERWMKTHSPGCRARFRSRSRKANISGLRSR